MTTALRKKGAHAWRRSCLRLTALVVLAGAIGSAACNSAVREGRAASFLIIEQLLGAPGSDPEAFSNVLASDVITVVERTVGGQSVDVPTIFSDNGRVVMRLGFKDPGTPANPTAPTTANFITVTRYRVVFRRADGRNTPGVDVPYPFDGAATFTVLDIGSAGFTLVRIQAKEEAPLITLVNGGGARAISAIAEVTFYGHDQTGSEVSVVGNISVNFADFGDPE